MGDTDSGDRAD